MSMQQEFLLILVMYCNKGAVWSPKIKEKPRHIRHKFCRQNFSLPDNKNVISFLESDLQRWSISDFWVIGSSSIISTMPSLVLTLSPLVPVLRAFCNSTCRTFTVKRHSSSKRWQARQQNDRYTREATVQGLKSRAAFKLLQVTSKHVLPLYRCLY